MCNRWKVVARLGLEPRVFCGLCEHSTTELPSHLVISPTTFHLNTTRLHTSPGTLNSSTNFLWGNPRISYILPRRTYRLNHLATVVFLILGAICNRWKLWLDPRAFLWLCEHSTTELTSHLVISPTTFHLNPCRLHMWYTRGFYLQ